MFQRVRPFIPVALFAACLFWAGCSGVGTTGFFIATALSGLLMVWFGRQRVTSHGWLPGLITGAAFLGFTAAGFYLVRSAFPVLLAPLDSLVAGALDHPVLLAAVIALNAVGEELFFRGRNDWKFSLVCYCLMTCVFGVWLLPVAALFLGALMHVLAWRTQGLAAPILAHVVWTLGMVAVVV